MKSSKENKKGVSIILIIIIVAVLIVGVATTIILVNNPSRNEIPDDTIIEITEDKNESTKKDNTSSNSHPAIVDWIELGNGVYKAPAHNIYKADPIVVDGVELDGCIYQVLTHDIYIRVPNWNPREKGFTQMFFSYKEDIIIDVEALLGVKGSTLEQAQKEVVNDYIGAMENYAKIDNLSIEKDEYVTINGIDMYKFEGKLNCHGETGKYDLYTIGYTFIMDGMPCCVQGTVYNKDQPEEMINTTRDTVNAMIKTLRDKI